MLPPRLPSSNSSPSGNANVDTNAIPHGGPPTQPSRASARSGPSAGGVFSSNLSTRPRGRGGALAGGGGGGGPGPFGRGSHGGTNGQRGPQMQLGIGQHGHQEQQMIHPDDAIRQTDDDAASSRLSAVNAGYLTDPFVSLLYKPSMSHSGGSANARKPPLINVGTHHRTVGIDIVVDKFLDKYAHAQAQARPDPNGTTETETEIEIGVGAAGGPGSGGGAGQGSGGHAGGDASDVRDEGGCQIVSLGSGSDTRFWRLMSRSHPPKIAKYVEIDFPHLTSPKAQRIARSKKLQAAVAHSDPGASTAVANAASTASASAAVTAESSFSSGTTAAAGSSNTYKVSQGGTRLDSAVYTLLPLDLRPSPSPPSSSSSASSPSATFSQPPQPSSTPSTLPSALSAGKSIHELLDEAVLPLLNPDVPTLFLAECLFPYMPPDDACAIISWFGSTFNTCVGVVYEMCGLDDGFGKVMRRNLASRNLSIPGSIFPTPASQGERFLDAAALGQGVFTHCGAKTLWQVREDVIDHAELQRISRLEILDEIEELKLVLEHYVIAWGTKGVNMDDVGL
ncbi:hypothetical protein IAU59_006133 [Kwoniella sp. CBS 9459]